MLRIITGKQYNEIILLHIPYWLEDEVRKQGQSLNTAPEVERGTKFAQPDFWLMVQSYIH